MLSDPENLGHGTFTALFCFVRTENGCRYDKTSTWSWPKPLGCGFSYSGQMNQKCDIMKEDFSEERLRVKDTQELYCLMQTDGG